MTNGIIQKVLKKYRPLRKGNGNYPYFTPKIYNQMERELIKEIKKITYHQQDIPNCTCEHCLIIATVIEILIGDNQE